MKKFGLVLVPILVGFFSGLIVTATYFEICERAGIYNRPFDEFYIPVSIILGASISGTLFKKGRFNWKGSIITAILLFPTLIAFGFLYECGHGNCI